MTNFEWMGSSTDKLPAPMSELVVGAFVLGAVLVDEDDGEGYAMPTAVVAVCRRTLMIAGLHVSNAMYHGGTLFKCLGNAFRRKDPQAYGAIGPWLCEGAAERIVVDPIVDLSYKFDRHTLKTAELEVVRETGSSLVTDLAEHWSRSTNMEVDVANAGRTPFTERLFGERMRRFPRVTLSDLEARLVRWAVDGYNADPVLGIERTPLEIWEAASAGFVPRPVPRDVPAMFFRPENLRTIGPNGVEFADRLYWSDELPELIRAHGPDREYEVRFVDGDEGAVEIQTPYRKWVRLLP